MRFEIAQSLNGKKIMYIARDTNGVVRLREETLEKIHDAIREFNDMLAEQAEARAKTKTRGKDKDKGTDEVIGSSELKEEELAEEMQEEEEAAVATQTPEAVEEVTQPSDTILVAALPNSEASQKKFLHSEIKEQIEEKKRKSGKKSFWDKLK